MARPKESVEVMSDEAKVALLEAAGAAFTADVTPAELSAAIRRFQSTHLNQKSQALRVDGIVGPETLWALRNPHGAEQRLGLDGYIPRGLSQARAALLLIAHSYSWVKESPDGSNRGEQIDQWTGMQGHGPEVKGPAWCAFYASAVWLEALGSYPLGGRLGSCYATRHAAQQLGCYVEPGGGREPQPGDQAIIIHPTGRPGQEIHGHSVFVSSVGVRGDALCVGTVEGNCGNRVARRIRSVGEFDGWVSLLGDAGEFDRGLPEGLKFGTGESTR